MANNNSTFNLSIKTKVDSTELNKLKQQLKEIQLLGRDVDFTTNMNPTQIQHMITAARQLDSALTAAFDVELNTLNIQKFDDYLKKAGTDLQQIQKGLYNAGAAGQASFAKTTAELFKFNTAAKQTNVFLDKMADTMANTVRWGITSSIFNNIVGSVQKAYYYIEDLDTSLNDIRIVTGKSADEMARFAEQANEAAKTLATTTTDYTEGALIYYQQGLDDETVKTLTDITAKTSNVTGQSMQAVSEQLTAVWNGYQVANEAAKEGMQVYEEYVDKMAAVGATTASDLEELATAMSKVASAASSMGVGFDELSAQIATIVSVTRQAPESVGTALKTIYARLGDLQVDGVDEFGVSLGDVSGKLQMMGIDVVDMNGNMREMDVVMTEVAEKWNTWTDAQREAAAVAMAGKRQYNNLISLFDNWDMYTETLETAQDAAGTLDRQQNTALESLNNKLERLTATAEDLYDSLFDEESLKDIVDGIIPVVQGLADMADAIGGLNTLLPALGSIGVQVFSKQLANGLATFKHNLALSTNEAYKQNQAIDQLSKKYQTLNFKDSTGQVSAGQKAVIEDMVRFTTEMLEKRKLMTTEEEEYYNTILDEKAALAEQVALLAKAKEHRDNNTGFGMKEAFGDRLNITTVEQYSASVTALESKIQKLHTLEGNIIGAGDVEKTKIALFGFTQELENMGASSSVIEKIKQDIKNLSKVIEETEQISKNDLDKIINEFKDFQIAADQVNNLEQEVNSLGQTIKRNENKLKNGLNFKATVDNIMKTVGAIGQLASSIQTLQNLGSIWQNNDLTLGDKLLQTIMNLSFALPMLVTSFMTLKDIFYAYAATLPSITMKESVRVALLATETALLQSRNKQEQVQYIANKMFNEIKDQETKKRLQNALAIKLEEENLENLNQERLEELAMQTMQEQGVQQSINIKNIDFKGIGIKLIDGFKNIVNTIFGFIQKFIATAIGKIILSTTIVIAAIGGIIAIAYHTWTEGLKNVAKEEKKSADEMKELTNTAKEQKDAIDNIINSYKELQKQYKNGDISLGELRSKVYNLCIEYNQQDLAMKALIADYNELNSLMEKAQNLATEDLAQTSKDEKNQLVKSMSATMFANADESIRDRINGEYTFDIIDGIVDDGALQEILREYIDENEFINGHVNANALIEALAKNPDLLSKISEIENSDSATKIVKAYDFIKEDIERYTEVSNLLDQNLKDSLIQQHSNSTKSIQEYEKAVQNMIKETKDELFDGDEEAAREWATGALGTAIGNTQLVADYNLAYQIHDKTGKSFIEIEKELNKISSDEKRFITIHLDTALAEDSLNTFLNNYGEYQEADKLLQIKAFIEATFLDPEKTSLTEEEINNLYGFSDFETMVGLTQEAFDAMDFDSQRLSMLQYYAESETLLIANKDEAIAQAKETIAAIEAEKAKYKEENKDKINGINPAMYSIMQETGFSLEDMKEAVDSEDYSKMAYMGRTHLGEEAWNNLIINDQEGLNRYYESLKKEIYLAIEGQEEYNAKIAEFDAEAKIAADTIANLEGHTIDYEYSMQLAEGAIDGFSKQLDDLQSGYNDLTSIVESYNETGFFTVDAVQQLLSLSPEMLSYLQFENGQLSINTEAMQQSALARIDAAQAALLEQLQLGLLAIQQGNAADAATNLMIRNAELAMSTSEAGTAAYKGAEAWHEYASAIASAAGMTDFANNEQAQAFSESIRKQLAALQSVKDGITKGGFGVAMTGEAEDIEDIYDRYWTLNKELDKLAETLEDLDEIQSHLHGKALIESLEKENKLLKDQEETYNRLYEAQKIEAAELRGKLSQYGVKFQDGNVVNYDAAVKGLDEAQYEKFQELFERYDELFYSEMVDTLNKIEEINYERLANELEAFEVQLELNLETTEAERALDEFTKELNKDFKSVYENFDEELKHIVNSYNTYIRKNGTIDSIISAIQTVQKEIDALRDNDDTTDSTMFATVGDAQEKLKELQEQLQDATLESRDLMEEYWDTYLDSIDQAAEKFEKLSEEFDAINDELDYQRELIELIYGPEAYGMQKQIFDAQINNSLAQVDSAKQQVDLWQSYYDQAEEGTEEQLKYAGLLKDAQAELNDLTLEHIQLLKDDYANTMDDILTKLEKDITGGLGLDDMREEWEEAVKESEKYYDNIERIFELETLENKFQNAIDNTASPKYQQAIKDLMDDQLATLKDKEQLTEYDVQLAEKRLGILQAEAALEDAQNAKNAMKLVRGASGNWEYQYVADTSDIENKQQALRESYQELYEFAKDAQLNSIEALMEAKDDYITKLHEIKDDETLSEEEKLIKIAEINDKYWNEEEGIITKLQQDYYNKTQTLSTASAESLLGLYKADESAYYDMTEYEKGLVDEFKHHAETSYTDMYLAIQEEYKQDQEKFDSYVDSNLLHWQTAASDMAAAWNGDEDSIRTNVNEAYESISDATTEYSLELERLEATSGDSFGEEGITGDIKTAIDYTNTLKTKTGELVDLANSRLPEYKSQIEKIDTAWTNVANKINNASEQLKYYLELSEIEVPEPTTSGDGSGSVGSGNNTTPGGGGTPDEKVDNPFVMVPTHYKVKENILAYPISSTGFVGSGEYPSFPIDKNIEVAILGKYASNSYKVDLPPYDNNIDAVISEEDYKNKLTQLDTGGYTGDWSGGEGRMAMLHSKELVLNKVDTENILNAVSAVRDMTGITSSVGSAIMQNIKAMIMEVLGISAGTGRATRNTNNETSNVFHITAEFPNANSVETIQEAILSLPNIASQYVAENRR